MRMTIALIPVLVAGLELGGPGPLSAVGDTPLDRGIELFEDGEHEAAAKHFRQALRSAGSRPAARHYLGRIHLAQGDSERAVEELEAAVAERGDDPDYHYWLGRALLEEVDHSRFPPRQLLLARSARGHFERAVGLEPSHIDARTWLASYLISAPAIAGGSRAGAFEQAAEVEKRDRVVGHRVRGTLYWKTGEHAKALAEYQSILRSDPEDVDALYQSGKLHQRLGAPERAFESLDRAVRLDPRHADALYALGRNGADSGVEPERSLEALQAYLDHDPEPPPSYRASAFWCMGRIYERLEQVAKARHAYRQAIALDPDHEDARTALRGLEREDGRGG